MQLDEGPKPTFQPVSGKTVTFRPEQDLTVLGGWGSQISRQSALEVNKFVSPTHWPPLHHRKYSWHSLLNKTNRRTDFQNLFCKETLHVSSSSSAHHQEFSTVHSALVYDKHVWWQISSTTILIVFERCHQTCMTFTSAECTVENSWWWAEELPETCWVSLQNKFGKSARLFVFF